MIATLPTWEESEKAVISGNASPLHVLIYEHEPAGDDEKKFRATLSGVISTRDEEIGHLRADLDEAVRLLADRTPPMPAEDANCHSGIVPQFRCVHCSRIAEARAFLAKHDKA